MARQFYLYTTVYNGTECFLILLDTIFAVTRRNRSDIEFQVIFTE